MPSGEPDGTLRIKAVVQYTAAELKAMIHGSVGTVTLDDEGTESNASEYTGLVFNSLVVADSEDYTPEAGSKILELGWSQVEG